MIFRDKELSGIVIGRTSGSHRGISSKSEIYRKAINKWTDPNQPKVTPNSSKKSSQNLGWEGATREESVCDFFLKTLVSLIVFWPDTY